MQMCQNSEINLKYEFLNDFNDFVGLLSSKMIPPNHLFMN